ncbi:hypothetical protein [Enterobacter ludwigii]
MKNILDWGAAAADFALDPRIPVDRLESIADYSGLIPFASNQDANWNSFWLSEATAQDLANIYQDAALAERALPVQQTFLLALLQLLETPGLLLNTLPARHRSLYYRELLGLNPRGVQPDSVAVSFTLQGNTEGYLLPAGTALDGGQDNAGNALTYLTDDQLLITPQLLSVLCWTQQDEGEWRCFKILDVENNITFPDDGIRLFSKGEHEIKMPVDKQSIYLGFSDVAPGEMLSLYWSLDGASPLSLKWFYYNQLSQWTSLAAGVQDGTGGLSGSGLWRVVLPEDSAVGSDVVGFSESGYWLKADVESAQEVAKLKGVFSGAVTATLETAGDIDDSHFAQPLPAGTLTQLTTPQVEISHVSQPLPSSGGRGRETETAFLQRIATRIAHRQRAISWGNMRSMLMDNYPELFDIQFPDVEKLSQIPALTIQTLLAIPDSRYRDNDDALRPTLSAVRLTAMADWLMQYTSLWAEPEVMNPVYIDVTVTYNVMFIDGIGPDYGYNQLERWLQQNYMPWGEDQQQAVTPGKQIDYYQLLATIQQLPLVQRVLSLTLKRPEEDAQDQQETIHAGEYEVLILIPNPQKSEE